MILFAPKTLFQKQGRENTKSSFEDRFPFEMEHMMYRKVVVYKADNQDKSTIMHLITLEALINASIGFLSQRLEETKIVLQIMQQ